MLTSVVGTLRRGAGGRARGTAVAVVGAVGANLVLRVGTLALGLLVGLVLSRALGPALLGLYAFAVAIGQMMSVIGRLGLEPLLVREVALHVERGEWDLLRGITRWTEWSSGAAAVLLAGPVLTVGWFVSSAETWQALMAATVLSLMLGLAALRAAALRGLHAVVVSNIPIALLRPGALLVMAGILSWSGFVSAPGMVWANVMAWTFAWLAAVLLWSRLRPLGIAEAVPLIRGRVWLLAAAPMLLTSGLHVVIAQADILMLKALASDESTGIYSVVSLLARLVALPSAIVGSVLSPTIVALYNKGQTQRLQTVVSVAAAGVTLSTLLGRLVGDDHEPRRSEHVWRRLRRRRAGLMAPGVRSDRWRMVWNRDQCPAEDRAGARRRQARGRCSRA